MTIVEWAQVVLPLGALIAGACLVWRHAAAIDRWVAELDKLWPR